ncbi:MAG TPA: DUF805 domain-containing protein [Allosphingosinicella sp.]|nr:DUF805 domain-containing protein [Allosphingosinicella sp.]
MSAVAFSVLPLKRYAEFRGRSTRTELIAFYLLVLTVTVLLGWGGTAISFHAQQWVSSGLALLLFCPSVALAVRRLHDSGRSGWWLLVALPFLVASAWAFFARPGPWAIQTHLEFPWWIDVPLGLTGAALAILLLLDDEPGPNRFGPNPRYGPAGEPA